MAGTNIYSVYRRTARAAAQQRVVKKTSNVDVEKARTDFAYFCEVVGDKPPAAHHKEWHTGPIEAGGKVLLHAHPTGVEPIGRGLQCCGC